MLLRILSCFRTCYPVLSISHCTASACTMRSSSLWTRRLSEGLAASSRAYRGVGATSRWLCCQESSSTTGKAVPLEARTGLQNIVSCLPEAQLAEEQKTKVGAMIVLFGVLWVLWFVCQGRTSTKPASKAAWLCHWSGYQLDDRGALHDRRVVAPRSSPSRRLGYVVGDRL